MKHSIVVVAKRRQLLTGLKQLIEDKKLTQEVVAVGAGIRQNNASRILQGQYNVNLDTVIALADSAGFDLQLVEKK